MVRNKKEKYLNDKSDPKKVRTRRNETRSPGKQLSRASVNKDGDKRKVLIKDVNKNDKNNNAKPVSDGTRGIKSRRGSIEPNPLEVELSSKVNSRKCGTERKMRKLKSIVIPIEHKDVSDEKSKTINDISELDEIAVMVHAAEDNFMSDEDPGLEEEIYPIQEEDALHISEPVPGTSGGRMETMPRFDLREYRNDPVFKEMVNMAVAEQLKQDKQVNKGISGTLAGNTRESIGEENLQIQNIIESAQMPQTPCNQSQPKRNNDVVKSPSDTMIYAPALARNPVMGGQEKGDDLINQISDFVAKM